MNKKLGAVLDALIPATLVATIAWTCLSAADYVAVLSAERLLEGWALLPLGWGDAHERGLAITAVLIAVPVIALIARAIYRIARASLATSGDSG